MLRRNLCGALVCLGVGAQVAGCYADSVSIPEPTLSTPGAYIAVPFEPVLPSGAAGAAGAPGAPGASGQAGAGNSETPSDGDSGAGGAPAAGELYRLIRVLAVLDVSTDFAIFHLQYGLVESLDAAREATKARSSGPPPPLGITSLGRLESLDAVVVGYRSLTQEELDVIR